MVEVDLFSLASLIVVIITGVGIAVGFMVRANMRINQLEKDLQRFEKDFENHPLLRAFSQMGHENLVSTLNNILSNSKVERGTND